MKATLGGLRKEVTVFLALCLIAGLCLAPSDAGAKTATPTTVKATVFLSGQPPKVLPAGDDKAHFVGLGQKVGKATFSDGKKAQYSNVYFMDGIKGKLMKVWGYSKMTFKDGSWFYTKWQAAIAGLDKAGKPILKGTGEFLKGTGPYQGITGSFNFINRYLPPSKEFPKGVSVSEVEFTYTLPSK